MRLEEGSTVEFTYTDKSGNTQDWRGEVRSVNEEKGLFKLNTDEGVRAFRFERIEGELRVLA